MKIKQKALKKTLRGNFRIGINELDRIYVKSQQYEDNIAFFSHIINHKVYKLNKNKLLQIRPNHNVSSTIRYSDVGTTLYLSRRRRDLYPTPCVCWDRYPSNHMSLVIGCNVGDNKYTFVSKLKSRCCGLVIVCNMLYFNKVLHMI